MKDALIEKFLNIDGDLTIEMIGMRFLISGVLGLAIYLSYKFSHSRAIYSARFNVSLIMLTLVTTMVMSVIGNNVALSLGMVGALSIVRFRTAIKDPRDTIYIFWCIVNGICCGVDEFTVSFIGSGIIFIFLLFFGGIKANDRYLLVIHGEGEIEESVEEKILVFYKGKAILRVKNTRKERYEYIYELSRKVMEGNKNNIIKELYEIKGVENINLICQNEETSR
ncbi:MAG: DUF4956 domain-containing protein [Clostridium sp.]|uniref:DUF4956 domain-containing protein n=1 Tax=Clostridium sp. TaxID=1506 RepID=UPI003F2B555D